MFDRFQISSICVVMSLTVFTCAQSVQAIPLQLTSSHKNIDNLHLVIQLNQVNCPTNSPRSCTPGGSR